MPIRMVLDQPLEHNEQRSFQCGFVYRVEMPAMLIPSLCLTEKKGQREGLPSAALVKIRWKRSNTVLL